MSEMFTNIDADSANAQQTMPSGDVPDITPESIANMPDGRIPVAKNNSKGAGNFTRFAERRGGKLEQWIGQESDQTLVQNKIKLTMEETKGSAIEAAKNGVCHAIVTEWVRMSSDGLYQYFLKEMEHIPEKYLLMQDANSARLDNFNRINREMQDADRELQEASRLHEETLNRELAKGISNEDFDNPDGVIKQTEKTMREKGEILQDKLNRLQRNGLDWLKSPVLEQAQINQERVFTGRPTVDEIIEATKGMGMYMLCLSGPDGAHMIGLEVGRDGLLGFGKQPYRFVDPNSGAMSFDSKAGFKSCLEGHWRMYLDANYSQHCCIYRCGR